MDWPGWQGLVLGKSGVFVRRALSQGIPLGVCRYAGSAEEQEEVTLRAAFEVSRGHGLTPSVQGLRQKWGALLGLRVKEKRFHFA